MKEKNVKQKKLIPVTLFVLFLTISMFFGINVWADDHPAVSSVAWSAEEIIVDFSKPMDSSTINNDTFKLIIEIPGLGYGTVAGKVKHEGTTGMFTSSGNLVPGRNYTFSVTTDAKDTEGNPLQAVHKKSFILGRVKEGVFWDGPVRGLAYVSGEQSGFTDDEGRFEYEEGETVTFMVGDIVIGEAPASPMMTPGDLVADAQGYTDTTVANIVRFLETLDEDENPYNGIDIEADEKYDDESIDFTLPEASFETEAEAIIDEAFGDQRDLVSLQDAMDHFRLALLMVPGSEIERKVQEILDGALGKRDIPGVSLSVLTLDGSKWSGTSGVSDMETGEHMRPDHRMRVGSVTKTFTGMTILQLAQEGKLNLDDTVADWLPDGTLSDQYDPGKITIKQLLNHTSGLFNYTEDKDWYYDYVTDVDKTYTHQDLVNVANNNDPTGDPGAGFSYTNTGPVLLGMIIEKITGSTWEQEIRNRFIKELGLKDTFVPETGEIDMPDNYAHGYFDLYGFTNGKEGEEGVLDEFSKREPSGAWSVGSIISTTQDVARWFMAIGEGEFLNQEYHTIQMELDKVPMPPGDVPPPLDSASSGLAIFFSDDYDLILHPGQIPGYEAGGLYHRKSHAAFGLAANRTLPDGELIQSVFFFDVLDVLFGKVSDTVKVKEGVFWDGPVRGLAYVSGEQSGFTDDEGRFEYEEGETVTFMVGDIVIGEAPASPMMTPGDLVEDALDYTDTTVTNIVRFLETLDQDENPYNGIDIEADESYDDESIDFTLPEASFETEAEAIIDEVFEDQRDLVSLQDAMNHFRLALLMVPGSEIEQSVQQILDDAINSNDLPGVSLSVLALDGSKWNGTSGVSDRETSEHIRPDHRMRVGSVTKTFTAITILQLAQEGKLSLDDTVAEWLPGDILSDQYDPESITIRQLLNHTSGLFNYPSDDAWYIYDYLIDVSETFTHKYLVDIANNHDPTGDPGAGYSYTSTGPVLLGMIIEKITGSTWEEEVRNRFIEPMGLENTLVPETGEKDIPGNYAHGYFDLYGYSGGQAGTEGVLLDYTKREPSGAWSVGNMISTTQDVAQWFMAVGKGEFLNQEYQNILMTDQFDIPGAPIKSGLGVFFNTGYDLMLHPGQIPGYDCSGSYHLESHAAFGVSTNRTVSAAPINPLVLFPVLDVLFGDLTEEPGTRSRSDKWYIEPSGIRRHTEY